MKPIQNRPPPAAKKLLTFIKHYSEEYAGTGDLAEEYREIAASKGRFRASFWYWVQVFYALPACILFCLESRGAMIKNNFKIAFRHIKRKKVYSLINISGLTIGFTCFILIFLFVRYEFSYDRQHSKADRIYKAIFNFTEPFTMGTPKRAHSHPLLGPTLLNEFPEIETATRFSKYNSSMVRVDDQKFLFDKWVWADPRFFEVFDIPLIYGDPQTALKDPFTVVIDEQTANKLYGEGNPVGKTLHFIRGREESFKITGVIKNFPHNSHLRPNLLGSFETQNSLGLRKALNSWDAHWFHTYLLLKNSCDPLVLETKIRSFIQQKIHPLSSSKNWNYKLQPLSDIHLKSTDILNNLEITGDIKYVTICSLIACFILFIAGVNFVNLSTARSFTRTREVGIRKVVGANRSQLIRQFLSESLLLTYLSLTAAVGLSLLTLKGIAGFLDRDFGPRALTQPGFVLTLLAAGLLVGLLSGCFPAFYLSGSKPVSTLKGTLSPAPRKFNLRNFLVLFQFTISLFLIICTLVISGQLKLIRTKKLGFEREHVVVMNLVDSQFIRNRRAVKEELLQNSGIKGVTFTQTLPTYINWGSDFDFEGRDSKDYVTFYFSQVDYDYLDVFDMKIAAGRNFSRKMTTDTSEGGAFLLNETAVKELGWQDPIGKKIWFPETANRGTVVGVVKDFFSQSLHFPAQPVALILNTGGGNIYFASIKIDPDNIPLTLAFIKQVWQKYSDGYPFEYNFLDREYDKMYKSEMELGVLFRTFTLLALFISGLGLFGLASFTAERRTKEIGIRKVLGATVLGITLRFSGGFFKWVLLANLISWPLAYLAMRRWLQNFACRINPGIGLFAAAAGIALMVALLTVSFQSIKAASADPVESLRYE